MTIRGIEATASRITDLSAIAELTNKYHYKVHVIFCRVCLLQTPSDAPWTESSDIKVDDSNVLGYVALTRFEQWAKDVAPLIFAEFDQASLFSGSVPQLCLYIRPTSTSITRTTHVGIHDCGAELFGIFITLLTFFIDLWSLWFVT